MAIELDDDAVRGIVHQATRELAAADAQYAKMRPAFRSATAEAVIAMCARLKSNPKTGFGKDEQIDYAVYACAMYELAATHTRDCVELLNTGRGDDEVIQHIFTAMSGLFRPLGALALILNGGPLTQGYIDDGISDYHSSRAQKGGLAKTSVLKDLERETIRLYDEKDLSDVPATEAANTITPKIIELAKTLAAARGGKPLLSAGTTKPLDWIRGHRKNKKAPSA